MAQTYEQKYKQLEVSFRDACERIRELSELILKLKNAEYVHTPKLIVNGPHSIDYVELRQITKSDYDLFQQWKYTLRDFDL